MKGNKLIGALLDAWEGTPNDEKDTIEEDNPALFKALEAMSEKYSG